MSQSVQSIPGIADANKHWNRERVRQRQRNSVRAVEDFADEPLEFWNDEPKADFTAIQQNAFGGDDAQVLDRMLEAHGLRAVLCTLHGLLHSRVSHDVDDPYCDLVSIVAEEKSSRSWEHARDAVGEIALDEKVNAK